MKSINRFPAVLFALAAIGSVLMLASPAVLQGNSGVGAIGAPDDWTHHHLVFTNPGSFADAARNGSFDAWYRVASDPRYTMQLRKRAGASGRATAVSALQRQPQGRPTSRNIWWKLSAGTGLAGISLIFLPGRRRYRATLGLWLVCLLSFAMGCSGAGNAGTSNPGNPAESSALQRDWGQSLGVGGSTGVPLAGTTWFPVFPAKYTFDINATPDCSNDYVIFPTNLAGVTAGQASVIAYRNLYAGAGSPFCGVANPTVYWSYNTNFDNAGTATNGRVQTSPVLSLDGTKVAFVETRAAGGAILHLLKWKALDGGAINTAAAPTTATVWTADGLAGHCPVAGACMISIVLNGAQADTASSPFYDYARDAIYVGDDNGVLHKIINAFGVTGATPSEMTTGNWPIIVHTTFTLTSATLDSVSGNIFVADSGGRLSYVRETFTTTGTCAAGSPPCLGSTSITPAVHVIADGPILDSTTGKVLVFMGNDGAGAGVIQSDVTLSASVTATLGAGTARHLHSGAFDNTYLTGNGSVGSLYTCGSSATSAPTIQRIGFTNSGRVPASPFANPIGTMNPAVDAATLTVATGAAECTPVTELFNANAPAASRDQIFFGVQNLGSGTNCGGAGCVMSVNVTGTPGALAIASSIAEINGPSGIIVDNNANTTSFPQSSSLYFSRQGNSTAGVPCGVTVGVGCAVKVTQAGLN